ncbi:hypothetical protein SSCG_01367 [Streptomyces clavuligerus]|nr:hypothetical protein SSCG_01367 [Streptomyces clavuligerus]
MRCCCHPAMLPGPAVWMRRLSTGHHLRSYESPPEHPGVTNRSPLVTTTEWGP